MTAQTQRRVSDDSPISSPPLTPQQTGATPLLLAAQRGHADVLRILLRSGAAAQSVTRKGGAGPLHLAAMRGHADAARALLDACPSLLEAAKPSDGATALHLSAGTQGAEALLLLLSRGADVTACDSLGATPLHAACAAGAAAATRALLAAGCAPDARRGDGVTPLMLAADCSPTTGDADGCLRALLSKSCDLSLRSHERRFKGATALHYAAAAGREAACRALRAAGADCDAVTLEALKPFSVAATEHIAALIRPPGQAGMPPLPPPVAAREAELVQDQLAGIEAVAAKLSSLRSVEAERSAQHRRRAAKSKSAGSVAPPLGGSGPPARSRSGASEAARERAPSRGRSGGEPVRTGSRGEPRRKRSGGAEMVRGRVG